MSDTTLLLIEVGALLLVLSLLGRLANRIGISPIPLYLLAGLAVGKGGVIPLSESSDSFFEVGSEIGVILLLLMLGLEYSPAELVKGLRTGWMAGIWDMVLNAIPGAAFALIMGWGPIAAVAAAGITWSSSSGVVAKVLRDLDRLANRETPSVLSILVLEDLSMAFYLPILSALVVGQAFAQATITVAIAVAVVVGILLVAVYFGKVISRVFSVNHLESLLIGVLGLAMLVAGLAAQLNVSSAVGAFLVGIAISGQVAHQATQVLSPLRDFFATVFFLFFGISTDPTSLPPVLLPALALAVVTIGTKVLTGYLAAKKAGIAVPGRWRAGLVLTPRGEFSIVIAALAADALATTAGPAIATTITSTTTAYVLMTIIAGPLLARIPDSDWFKQAVRKAGARKAAGRPAQR